MVAKRLYFFSGSQYSRYDIGPPEGVPGGWPKVIAAEWSGLFTSGIDAALNYGDGRIYFFKGEDYVLYDLTTDAVLPGWPKKIRDEWSGVFDRDIDAAVNWGNGKVYFFKGPKYVRYDIATDTGEYEAVIANEWPGLYTSDIDAAVNLGNGKAYFFKGAKYMRYDIATDQVEFEAVIANEWPGLFTSGIDAALEWPHGVVTSYQVPVTQPTCVNQAAGPNLVNVNAPFKMNADFGSSPYPAACQSCEYRQFVRGRFVVNGTAVNHLVPDPAGGPNLPMLPRPTPGAATDNFREDGVASPAPAGINLFYGHRAEGTADPGDQYLPDRERGCQYRGADAPGLGNLTTGATFRVELDFRGRIIDVGQDEAILRTSDWAVSCAGTA